MKYARFTDRQLVELTDVSMLSLSTQNVLTEIIKKFVAFENTVYSGMQVRQTSTASGQVQITAGYGVQVMPAATGILELPVNQTVNVLSGTPNPDGGVWGTGQAADVSERYDIVCIAYAQKTGDAQLKYFYNDQVVPPEEYQANVDTTISDWFDIQIVHGTPNGGVPATPDGYFKLAEVRVSPGTGAITDAMITDKRGTLGADVKTSVMNVTTSLNSHVQTSASEVAVGHIQLATSVETSSGSINTKAVHPAALKIELDKKISHALATAANDFLVGDVGGGSFVKKTLAEVRTTLGLGDAAYKSVGTVAGTVAAGDHTHTGYEPAITKKTAFNVDFETSASNIKMNGTQSLGSLGTVARADHVHPSDTSKISHSLATAANDFLVASGTGAFVKKTLSETQDVLGLKAAAFLDVGTTGSTVASGDHSHTGVYEPAITKNTAFNASFETTATVIKMNGTQAVGTAATIARADHVHPSDTAKVSKAGDTMTGALKGVTQLEVGTSVTSSYTALIYTDADLWHLAVGGATGLLKFGGQTGNGAIIQAMSGSTPRDLYLQRDGGNVYINGTSTNIVWHAGNDGAASGLDADLLDGIQSTGFAQVSTLTAAALQSNTTLVSGLFVNSGDGILDESGAVFATSTTYWHVINMHHPASTGYNAQIIVPYGNASERNLYVRLSSAGTWSRWRKIMTFGIADNSGGCWDGGTTAPTGVTRINYSGYLYATRVYNAVFNDYAEYFERAEKTEPGDIVMLNPNGNGYVKAVGIGTRLVRGVHSDSYGHIVGGKGDEHDDENFIPVGLVGRVRVKIYGTAKKGQYVICSDMPGVGLATDDYFPQATLGQLDEDKTTEGVGRVRMFIRH